MRVLALLLITVTMAGCIGGQQEALQTNSDLTITITWSPDYPTVGEPVAFGLNVKSPMSGDKIESVIWKIGEEVIDESTPVRTFIQAGTVPIVVQVRTNLTGLNQEAATLTVLEVGQEPPKQAPVTTPPPTTGAPDDPLKIQALVDGAQVTFTYSWGRQADLVSWDFGDGQTSTMLAPTHRYGATGIYSVQLRASSVESIEIATILVQIDDVPLRPHVIVGVPDSGINPYHEIYRRPELTAHPCTYIQDFPCDVQELRLSLDARDYGTALTLDQNVWDNVRSGTWYWIPGTNIVAASCDSSHAGRCILDDGGQSHGTGTTSSVLMENPGAFIAFREGGPDITPFLSKKLPVDIYSVSWGHVDPAGIGLSFGYPTLSQFCGAISAPIYIKSSGNAPGPSILTDCWSGDPEVIAVGGAYANGNTQEETAGKDMDVVSYFCRPTANVNTMTGMRSSYCGTSFSAPTVAGALSKVILAIREDSGYLGSMSGEMVDPIARVSAKDVRDAMNHTASYSPKAQYSNSGLTPLNPAAPWLQWGWGFYDGLVADATIDHFLVSPGTSKPVQAVTYMETQYELRERLYG